MDLYTACSIVEGFSGQDHTHEEHIEAWQFLYDSKAYKSLQGWYGRNIQVLLENGDILQ